MKIVLASVIVLGLIGCSAQTLPFSSGQFNQCGALALNSLGTNVSCGNV